MAGDPGRRVMDEVRTQYERQTYPRPMEDPVAATRNMAIDALMPRGHRFFRSLWRTGHVNFQLKEPA